MMRMLRSLWALFVSVSVSYAADDEDTNPLAGLGLTPAQYAQIMSYINGISGGVTNCNASSSLNMASLFAEDAADGFDKTEIMAQLSAAAVVATATAYSECTALELSSADCFNDCISYNHPVTLFSDTSSDDFYPKLMQVLEWYSMSGSPTGWMDVGNPDVCDYVGGEYCFTPLASEGEYPSVMMPHGCCAPGSCRGDDAVK